MLLRLCATAVAVACVPALGADFQVPQGGGRLPTVALVECLAGESTRNRGEYCRTTYACSDAQGVLWEGMGNHNGRRVTEATSPISNLRDCVLTIDDPATVQYFTGYRPGGLQGEVIGMVRTGRATVSVTVNTMETPSPNMLEQFLFAVQVATLQDWIDYTDTTSSKCSNHGCRASGAMLATVPATERTRCYIEQCVASEASGYLGQLTGICAETWARRESRDYDDYDCNELPHE